MSDHSSHSRLGAYRKWAGCNDWSAATAPARRAAWNRFYDQTDPALPEHIRTKQADMLRRAHFTEMARRATATRQAKARDRCGNCGRHTWDTDGVDGAA